MSELKDNKVRSLLPHTKIISLGCQLQHHLLQKNQVNQGKLIERKEKELTFHKFRILHEPTSTSEDEEKIEINDQNKKAEDLFEATAANQFVQDVSLYTEEESKDGL